jgi:putative transposase
MQVKRIEKHIINRQNKWYKLLEEKCHIAKNVYNHGNYVIRQEFIANGKYLSYKEVEKALHNDAEYPDYWDLGLANSSQQILRTLDKNWKSYFKAIKDFSQHPEKYNGKPKLPKYKRKKGLKEFALTYNQFKLKSDNLIHFPKALKGFTIKPNFIHSSYDTIQQVRFVPQNDRIVVEIVYLKTIMDINIKSNNYIGIDLGIDNFATIVSNNGIAQIINGKGLKSINHYYNKLIAENKSKLDLDKSETEYSHKLYSITNKRNDKVDIFMHNASSYVVNLALSNNISTIIIGKNEGWKNECNMGSVNNQKFVQIPYNSFISKLNYKCQEVGITLITVDESYTSGTSFLDNELPIKDFYNKKRRIKRGLFKSNQGKFINADVNAACQILRKVFVNAFNKPDNIGFVMNPVKVNVTQ